jgi:hypothetical protein
VEALAQGFNTRVPGIRQGLPKRLDVLGREQTTDPVTSWWDPTLPHEARTMSDDVLRELVVRDVGIAWPQRRSEETPEDYRARAQRVGRAIEAEVERVITGPNYGEAGDDAKIEMLERAIDRARTIQRKRDKVAAAE